MKHIFLGTVLMTFANHCVLGYKIWRKKRSFWPKEGSGVVHHHHHHHHQPRIFILPRRSQPPPPPPPQPPAPPPANANTDSSVLDPCSSATFVVLLILLAPVLSSVSLFLWGGLPLVLVTRLVLLSSFLVVMPLSVYVRKPHVRATLARELKEMLPWR